MPQALASAAFFLVEAGVPIWVIDAGLKIAAAVLINNVTSKLFGPKIPELAAGLRSVSLMVRSAVEYRKHVYGEARVSGPVAYNNKTVSGSDEYIWYVVTLCDGEIEDLVEVHIDGKVIPKADIAWTAGANGADG